MATRSFSKYLFFITTFKTVLILSRTKRENESEQNVYFVSVRSHAKTRLFMHFYRFSVVIAMKNSPTLWLRHRHINCNCTSQNRWAFASLYAFLSFVVRQTKKKKKMFAGDTNSIRNTNEAEQKRRTKKELKQKRQTKENWTRKKKN